MRSQISTKGPMTLIKVGLHLVIFLPILKAQFISKGKEDLLTDTLSVHKFNQTQRKPKPELQETSLIASEALIFSLVNSLVKLLASEPTVPPTLPHLRRTG